MFSTCWTFVSSPTKRRNYLPALRADATHHSERSRLPSRDRWSLVFYGFLIFFAFPDFFLLRFLRFGWCGPSECQALSKWRSDLSTGHAFSSTSFNYHSIISRFTEDQSPWSEQIQQDLNLIKFQFLGCFQLSTRNCTPRHPGLVERMPGPLVATPLCSRP